MKEYLEKRKKTLTEIFEKSEDAKLRDLTNARLQEIKEALIYINGGETEFIKLALTEKI
jgi:hypothetical protein